MSTEPPERHAFFLHWEACMALQLGSYVVGVAPDRPAADVLTSVINHRWPRWSCDEPDRIVTIRALALEHFAHEQKRLAYLDRYDWAPVAVWGSAATRAARVAAECMELAWLDTAEPINGTKESE